jgi:hypothetical protein
MSEKTKSVFETLSAINVNDKVEKKSGLTYLSWAWAWGEVKKVYPDAVYSVLQDPSTLKPYFFDEALGYMVMTSVTIQGQTLEMWLPVMDGANKSMKHEPYTYSTRYGDKSVEQASMFDINKTLMRCLVKNLAMFGLGHYIFAGEDLPESESDTIANTTSKPLAKPVIAKAPKANAEGGEPAKPQLKKDTEEWTKVVKWIGDNKDKTIEDIEKILKSRFTIAPAALKELGVILGTNG